MKRLLLALVGAPLLVAALLAAVELGFVVAGRDPRQRFFAPLRDASGAALLVATADPPFTGAHFRVERLAARAPAGMRRIVCVGDSTCYGHPFDPPVPFPDWIGARLKELLPDVKTEVVNLGSSGFASGDVLDLLEDTACAGADLLVVYVGHNEFLDRNVRPIRQPIADAVHRALAATRLGSALLRREKTVVDLAALASEQHTQLVRDTPLFTEAELARGRLRYREHLERIVELARSHGAAVLLVHPVSDALDTPCESSSFAPTTAQDARARFRAELDALDAKRRALDAARNAGTVVAGADVDAAFALLDPLAALDPGVQILGYERGRLLRLRGRLDEARRELLAAVDRDGSPIRATSELHAIVDEVAREHGARVVDPRPIFAAEAAPDLPGQERWFVDYCHPSLHGHELLADAILHEIARSGLLAPAERWRFGAEPSPEEYLRRGGYRPGDVAASWAHHALFVLGKAQFGGAGKSYVDGARQELERAIAVDRDCAPAWLGLGVVATIEKRVDDALAAFERAAAIAPASLDSTAAAYRDNAAVKALFDAAGLTFANGRVVRAR